MITKYGIKFFSYHLLNLIRMLKTISRNQRWLLDREYSEIILERYFSFFTNDC